MNCLRPVADWWTRGVIKDGQGQGFSRRDLVLAVANKDGGVHVDPALDRAYASLTRENSMGWIWTSGGVDRPMESPHLASVRQVAHELLSTLAYMMPGAFTDEGSLDRHLQANLATAPLVGLRVGRNDPCPCGSGAKFKRCHGRN